ncbi:MAG: glutathione S-transferase N-terminal domain-containing protein, partial [Holosporaceae bacterium]|nr:glutathione S-transferase N-terminal domain-containing protein [Holosporaceae bacterium]
MRRLYHYPLCSFGRLVRVYLKEKALDHELIVDVPWDRKHVFTEHHVFSDLPTLVEMDGIILEGWYAIIEHMEQSYRANSLLGITQKEKAETRRIVVLFNEMFFADVIKNTVFERVMK